MTVTTTPLGTRARLRRIEPGCSATCPLCDLPVKFKAKVKQNQVICNVYVKGRWDRVEHFHETCYLEAEEPHGKATP